MDKSIVPPFFMTHSVYAPPAQPFERYIIYVGYGP